MPAFVISALTLQEHLAYTVWASTRLLSAAEELSERELAHDFKTADRSIVGTLAHIFAADRVWLGRIKQRPPSAFISQHEKNLAVLQEQWPGIHAAWIQWAADLTDQSAHSTLSYHDLKGNPWTQPIWQVVLHVVNHASHHRGQVSGFLRALGHVPPPLDLTVFYREKLC